MADRISEEGPVDRNGLPTFSELLERRVRQPFDLPRFYGFLQREGSENVLDFWLDVKQHETLCRMYFQDLLSSGRSVAEEWPEYWEFARRQGSIYSSITTNKGKPPSAGINRSSPPAPGHPNRSTNPDDISGALPLLPPAVPQEVVETALARAARKDGPPGISRDTLIQSARVIYERYLGSGVENEIYFPPALRLHSFPNLSSDTVSPEDAALIAQVPDMFHAQKEYIFRAMEQDAYPRFLRALAFGNILPSTALLRMLAGIFVLWVGLSVGLSLIFLDVRPKSKRLFLFIPFTIAITLLISHQYELDPILAILGKTEIQPFRTRLVHDPYARKILMGRGIWVIILVSLFSTALTMIFWAVPGHRL